ncbi:MAG: hypothetical protein LUH20_11970 [Lachnospiraceae bacterium]|nr:hypothetical protein [Lachnospiraceae bacterium]MCD7833324.1 hypothetical protein [Lachnospiraceae bacterium]
MEKEQEKKLQEAQETPSPKEAARASKGSVSETWAEETIADLDEYIESQGIYLRQ